MKVVDAGKMDYREAWRLQSEVAQSVLDGGEDTLVLVEHPPVFTLGASFDPQHLLLPEDEIVARGIDVVRTDRGGDVTYHGPGQLVSYPVFDLRRHGQDLHRWLRELEDVHIRALARFGLNGVRFPPHTGVWTGAEPALRKIAAIGVKVRKWVSVHGVALNCDNDLASFELIVPCGIHGYGVTSLSLETGKRTAPDDAKDAVVQGYRDVFAAG
ncbi:MAG: lipoyl(octanoyl) transferase LipB [Armatimonadetes bacterium]|nr:lipoyl(octanoyl) transferase LipB [Armatimonadota bacterium]